MKRVLITGAGGFIGANLARRLIREGHQTHLVVSERGNPWRLEDLQRQALLHRLDLRDADRVRQTVEAVRPDWVFHLAAHGAYSWQTDATAIFQTNVMGTIHLVEACRAVGIEAMVNTGSSSEYGWKDHPPAEEEPLEPNSSYAVSKASATLYCRHVAQSSGLRLCTLRLYSVYGSFEEPGRLMPSLLIHALRGGYPPLASPHVARDFVYIDDCLDAYLLAVSARDLPPGAIYNVGAGVQSTLADVVGLLRQLFRLRTPPVWASMPDRTWDTGIWVADNRRIQHDLGWRPRTPLAAGLQRFRDWIAQPHWTAFYRERLGLRRFRSLPRDSQHHANLF
jgi:dolichol-phosphate mannosyltransferase